jgi:peroxiredoxin
MRAEILLLCALFASCRGERSPGGAQPTASEAEEEAPAPLPTAPLSAGGTVNDFRALAHTGQRFKLSEFAKRPVLLHFCPGDRSPRCQAVATALRDQWLVLNPSLSMAFGVTQEDTFSHMDFASEFELSHLLVADTDGSVHSAFGLTPGVDVAYLVGTDRRVIQVFETPRPEDFVANVLAALRPLGLERPVPPI